MKFAQELEFTTSRIDEMMELERDWRSRTEAIRPESVEFFTRDRDRPNTYVMFVVWDSFETAMKNNDLPETDEMSRRMAELCDGPVTFRNLDVLEERTS